MRRALFRRRIPVLSARIRAGVVVPRGVSRILRASTHRKRCAMSTGMNEEWRPVAGYEGMYEVSSIGNVRSLPRLLRVRDHDHRVRGKMLTKSLMTGTGYPRVTLSKDGRVTTKSIHRLVALAFVPGYEPGLEVCHFDGDRQNNVASNLRWDTRSGNMRDMVRHGRNAMTNRTHCPRGHEYSAENTKVYEGRRFCITCSRERGRKRQREYRARKRARLAASQSTSPNRLLDALKDPWEE